MSKMADREEPPPLFEDEDQTQTSQDDGDLFTSASEAPVKSEPVEEKKEEPATKEEDDDDLFADTTEEVPLDSPEETPTKAPEPVVPSSVLEPEPEPTPEPEVTTPSSEAAATPTPAPRVNVESVSAKPSAGAVAKTKEEVDEEEGGDKFDIDISVGNPTKKGDGMGAYMVYQVTTKTSIPEYKKPEQSVTRRFSDFLGLHDKLAAKHTMNGIIVPPAPEKSIVGMTKVKMGKEESTSAEFVEKRRAALERYLNRTAAHPLLRVDSDFKEFLELDSDLPKATSTSALSGAGVMRLFSKAADAVGKMTFKMEESDQWFEEKQQQVENLDQQVKKLHSSVESLVIHRKDLAGATASFAKSAAMLGNAEEHTALSRCMSQLAEIEEKIEQMHQEQADTDFFVFCELLKDYIGVIQSVKAIFHERVKSYKNWKESEQTLTKKRDTKAKLELQNKTDKIPPAQAEITEWEGKVEKGQEEFEKISETIRKEMSRFDRKRVRDFKSTIVSYLESLMNNQQQLIKYWETFLPEAKAIA